METALPSGRKDKLELSIFVTDEPTMAALNRKYRHKDAPTDVLSFSFTEKKLGTKDSLIPPHQASFLGEVVLCYPYIRSQVEDSSNGVELEGQPLSRALAWTAIHGVLHLLGRKHYRKTDKQVMQAEEQTALAALTSQGRKES